MFHFNVLVVSWKGKIVTRKALHPRNDCRHWIVPAGSFLTQSLFGNLWLKMLVMTMHSSKINSSHISGVNLMYFLLSHWGPRMLEDRYVSSPPNVFHRFLWLIPLLPGSIFRQTILYFWSEVVYYSTHPVIFFFK